LKRLALFLVAVAFALPASAAVTRHVDAYDLDSAKPGLKFPKVYNMDVLPNSVTTTVGLGAVPSASVTAGVTVTEYGLSFIHQTVYTLAVAALTVTDTGGANGAHASLQLYDFPSAAITILGVTSSMTVTAGTGGITDTASVVCSVGTVTTVNDNSTLTTTEADLMPSTAATLTGGIGACDGVLAASVLFDGTATAKDVFLNFAVPDAGVTAADTLVLAGSVTITWVSSGDN